MKYFSPIANGKYYYFIISFKLQYVVKSCLLANNFKNTFYNPIVLYRLAAEN